MFEWIAGTTAGKFISTFFISMLPVVELRAGLPYVRSRRETKS